MRILNTPIIVDSFQHEPGVTTYLLSHLHTDHTSGLSPSWNNGIIYTTKVTSFLLKEKFHINPDLIVELDYDDSIYIDLTKGTASSRKSSSTCIKLSIIDANHCVGSCMFLLEGYFGNILITGDFRFDSKTLCHPFLQDIKIDHLFLDDTFIDPDYDFPSRAEAGKEILDLVSSFPENYRFCIATDSLGKEELLVALAMNLKSLVVVTEERLHQINSIRRVVNLPDLFTSDESQGRIICMDKRSLNFDRIMKMREERPTVGILPSGWSKKALSKIEGTNIYQKVIWKIGYSLHSSHNELKQFVKYLKPKLLHSFSNRDDETLRKLFQKYCSPEAPKQFVTPSSLQEAMIEKINHQAAIITPNKKRKRTTPSSKNIKLKRQKIRGARIFDIIDEDDTSSSITSSNNSREYINVDSDDDTLLDRFSNKVIQNFKLTELLDNDDDDDDLADILGNMLGSLQNPLNDINTAKTKEPSSPLTLSPSISEPSKIMSPQFIFPQKNLLNVKIGHVNYMNDSSFLLNHELKGDSNLKLSRKKLCTEESDDVICISD